MIRVGQGYDVHRFGEGDHIILGGVRIPHQQGLVAHSDGDVLIHAICDALLGAAAMGDIGHHFPDNMSEYADADSRELLREVISLLAQAGFEVSNVDATIVAQSPRMGPHIDQMRQLIADDVRVAISQINIKATTTERLGFTGREEGIAVHAIALVEQV
jgi:2-C-methyl-D-erythritol 2,4-cyclodiphosphate synthase